MSCVQLYLIHFQSIGGSANHWVSGRDVQVPKGYFSPSSHSQKFRVQMVISDTSIEWLRWAIVLRLAATMAHAAPTHTSSCRGRSGPGSTASTSFIASSAGPPLGRTDSANAILPRRHSAVESAISLPLVLRWPIACMVRSVCRRELVFHRMWDCATGERF